MKKRGVLHLIDEDLKIVLGHPAWEWYVAAESQWALERYIEAIDKLK